MTTGRFAYQREKVSEAKGLVLNVGSYDDPAELKLLAPSLVQNCDIDPGVKPDVVMNMVEFPWPFDDDSVEMVVLGDIIEHLTWEEMEHVFREAHRIAERLVLTVPKDDRIGDQEKPWYVEWAGRMGEAPHPRPHITVVDAQSLKNLLIGTDWQPVEFLIVHYHFVPEGYLVEAVRA